jgi:hypothetical protein
MEKVITAGVLSEECIAIIFSFTLPPDACRCSVLSDLQIGCRLGSRVEEVFATGLSADHFSIGVVGVIAFECPIQEGSLFPSLP